tara:strand:+ start:729 stop:1001 length:273 start_codon:yes stop_codon:yes gene_type:complete
VLPAEEEGDKRGAVGEEAEGDKGAIMKSDREYYNMTYDERLEQMTPRELMIEGDRFLKKEEEKQKKQQRELRSRKLQEKQLHKKLYKEVS